MKKIYCLITTMLLLSCAQTRTENSTTGSKEEVVSLSPLQSNYRLTVNQLASLVMSEHGSVGSSSEVAISDSDALTLVSSDFTYEREPKDGETGGDAGSRNYIFKALKTGQAVITASELFRGTVAAEYLLTVVVE